MCARRGEERTETRTDRFPSADGMHFPALSRFLTAVALPLSSLLRPRCTHARGTRFTGALFETLVSRVPPPGMGWTLGTGISPRGPPKVTRGEVPKVLYCCATESFWRPFWYPFLDPTCTQFYKKCQNEAPKSCQKGGGLLAQQSPNNLPQQSPPKPILNGLWPPGDWGIVRCKESLGVKEIL